MSHLDLVDSTWLRKEEVVPILVVVSAVALWVLMESVYHRRVTDIGRIIGSSSQKRHLRWRPKLQLQGQARDIGVVQYRNHYYKKITKGKLEDLTIIQHWR